MNSYKSRLPSIFKRFSICFWNVQKFFVLYVETKGAIPSVQKTHVEILLYTCTYWKEIFVFNFTSKLSFLTVQYCCYLILLLHHNQDHSYYLVFIVLFTKSFWIFHERVRFIASVDHGIYHIQRCSSGSFEQTHYPSRTDLELYLSFLYFFKHFRSLRIVSTFLIHYLTLNWISNYYVLVTPILEQLKNESKLYYAKQS